LFTKLKQVSVGKNQTLEYAKHELSTLHTPINTAELLGDRFLTVLVWAKTNDKKPFKLLGQSLIRLNQSPVESKLTWFNRQHGTVTLNWVFHQIPHASA
jgi:hypothetical protein